MITANHETFAMDPHSNNTTFQFAHTLAWLLLAVIFSGEVGHHIDVRSLLKLLIVCENTQYF